MQAFVCRNFSKLGPFNLKMDIKFLKLDVGLLPSSCSLICIRLSDFLAAGTGLLGIVLKLMYPKMEYTFTEIQPVLSTLEANISQYLSKDDKNFPHLFTIKELDWKNTDLAVEFPISEASSGQKYDVILASDITIDPKDTSYIMGVLDHFIPQYSSTVMYIACTTFREGHSPFLAAAQENYFVEELAPELMHPDFTSDTIKILKLSRFLQSNSERP